MATIDICGGNTAQTVKQLKIKTIALSKRQNSFKDLQFSFCSKVLRLTRKLNHKIAYLIFNLHQSDQLPYYLQY